MPLSLSDIPAVTEAALDLVRRIQTSLDPDGEKGKKVSRAELGEILKAAGRLVVAIGVAIVD
jgi:hypothetical protein